MRRYIELDALVAKIDNISEYADKYWNTDYAIAAQRFADKLKDAIDTLSFQEVDLEKIFNDEYSKFSNDTDAMDYAFPIDLADYKDFARHFFELGLKARKGINQ